MSVAVVDINLDGVDDIAVGAPALVQAGEDPLQYHVGYASILSYIEDNCLFLVRY